MLTPKNRKPRRVDTSRELRRVLLELHDERHVTAYIRDQMGHSSIHVTVDVYAHLISGANVRFIDRLDSVVQIHSYP